MIQTLNRGILEDVKVTIYDGKIEKLYVGGKTEDPQVTGKINGAEVYVLGGKVASIMPGKSDNQEINVDQDKYTSLSLPNTVINNEISDEIELTYRVDIVDDYIIMKKVDMLKLNVKVITSTSGYENLFENEKYMWKSTNEKNVKVNEEGMTIAQKEGTSTITLEMLDSRDSVLVKVEENYMIPIIIIITELFAIVSLIVILLRIIMNK